LQSGYLLSLSIPVTMARNYYAVRIIIFDEKRPDAWFKYVYRFKDVGFATGGIVPKK